MDVEAFFVSLFLMLLWFLSWSSAVLQHSDSMNSWRQEGQTKNSNDFLNHISTLMFLRPRAKSDRPPLYLSRAKMHTWWLSQPHRLFIFRYGVYVLLLMSAIYIYILAKLKVSHPSGSLGTASRRPPWKCTRVWKLPVNLQPQECERKRLSPLS